MLNKDGQRELAYLVVIDDICPITGSDNCECAVVGGWHVMVRKGTFLKSDVAIYFEIDSLVDLSRPEFGFMSKYKGRIKTQRYKFGIKDPEYRGFYSEGLLMHPNDFGWVTVCDENDTPYGVMTNTSEPVRKVDDESRFVTELLNVHYYDQDDEKRKKEPKDKVPQMPKFFRTKVGRWLMRHKFTRKLCIALFGKKKKKSESGWPVGKFPGVSKTDQERCLPGQTKILTDKGMMQINKIVNGRLDVKVASVEKDGCISYKKITGYQKFEGKHDRLKTIRYSYTPGVAKETSLCCTDDHKILTDRGYVKAADLSNTDYVFKCVYAYDEEVLPSIYGMLLGDSNIKADKRSNGLLTISTTNGENQLEYLEYKKKIFSDDSKISKDINCGTFFGRHVYKWSLKTDPVVSYNLKQDWFINGKKTVTKNVIDKLTPESLAFWYMDDGSLTYRTKKRNTFFIRLATDGFSKEENDLLCDCLTNKFNIRSFVSKSKIAKDGHQMYEIVISPNEEVIKFCKLVEPYICDSMSYKLPFQKGKYAVLSYTKKEKVMKTEVLGVEDGQRKNKVWGKQFKYVYDIEVEDTHNFVAEGIITHNCENMPWVLNDKSAFIRTQKADGSSGTFILERKGKHKYEFYVCSRNVRMFTPDQESFYKEKNYYWEAAIKYDIENKMKDYLEKNPDIWFVCWQGEICAPGIQGNPQKLTETHLFCFHMTDSKYGRYDIRHAKTIWDSYGMETVPIEEKTITLPNDMEEFKLSADGYYDASICEGNLDCKREGFVYYKSDDPTFSFKNVSREYLLSKK